MRTGTARDRWLDTFAPPSPAPRHHETELDRLELGDRVAVTLSFQR